MSALTHVLMGENLTGIQTIHSCFPQKKVVINDFLILSSTREEKVTETGNQDFPALVSEGRLVPQKRDEQNTFSHSGAVP